MKIDKDGKMFDALWEIHNYSNGLEEVYLWADKDQKEVIKSVAGVVNVYDDITPYRYHIYFDPRYDFGTVTKNIMDKLGIETWEHWRK